MDLTVAIMVNAQTHDLKNPEKEAMRHRNGDPLRVHDTADVADLVGGKYVFRREIKSLHQAFIHVRDVPDDIAPLLKIRLTESIQSTGEIIRNSRFRVPPSVMPAAMFNDIRDSLETTIFWPQFMPVCRKKSVTVRLNPRTDDETTELRAADMR